MTVRVAVGLHIDDEDKVLVQERPARQKRAGLWEFPGGKNEENETFRDALVREWKEELGLTITVGDQLDECVIEFPEGWSHLVLFRVFYAGNQVPVAVENQKIARLPFGEAMKLPGVPSMARFEGAARMCIAAAREARQRSDLRALWGSEKLVRDRIPEIIRATGREPITRIAPIEEMPQLLGRKLVEEANEFVAKPSLEELGDVLDVADSLLAVHEGWSMADLIGLRAAKRNERGGFAGRVVLREP